MTIKHQLIDFLKSIESRNKSIYVKKKKEYVSFLNKTYPGYPLLEQIRLLENGYDGPKECLNCSNHVKRFRNDFCSTTCKGEYFKKSGRQNEIMEKVKKTNLEKYGTEYGLSSKTVQEKRKQTNLEKYGHENVFANESIKSKIKKTVKEKYGVECITLHNKSREKAKETYLKKYGVDSPLKSLVVQKKTQQTMRDRYGVEFWSHKFIDDEVLKILLNKDLFEKELTSIGAFSLSKKLDVTISTIYHRMDKYGIYRDKKINSYELAMKSFLDTLGIAYIHNCRSTLSSGKELDFVLPDAKIAIELCGLYWHSVKNGKDKFYHLSKLDECDKLGIRLLTVFDDEWNKSNSVIKSIIRNLLKLSHQGVYGRNTNIDTISKKDSDTFLSKFHLQGRDAFNSIRLAAKYDDEIIAVMTFTKKQNYYELSRYVSNGNNNPGVASKLFYHFVRYYDPEKIITYADRRWSNGDLYNTLGFAKSKILEPTYWYLNEKGYKRIHRSNIKKKDIIEEFNLHNDSKFQVTSFLMNNGYDMVWDCGHIKYIWTK